MFVMLSVRINATKAKLVYNSVSVALLFKFLKLSNLAIASTLILLYLAWQMASLGLVTILYHNVNVNCYLMADPVTAHNAR